MARRMLNEQIIKSDAFIDLPIEAQALYMHLNLEADDDGFINAPKRVARLIGVDVSNLDLLIDKRFLLGFDSGIVVIKHWFIHNTIRKDRKKDTVYQEELKTLQIKANGSYTDNVGDNMRTIGGQVVDNMRTSDGIKQTKQTNINKLNQVNTNKQKVGWLSDRLQEEEWKRLDNIYMDVAKLIDMIDDQVGQGENIKKPCEYIITVANNNNWPRKEG